MALESCISVPVLTRFIWTITILIPIGGLLIYIFLWGYSTSFLGFQWIAATISCLVSIPVHEAIHYYGFIIFDGVDKSYVQFKLNPKSMTPYVVCKAATTVGRYKMAALLPFLVLGIIPVAYGLLVREPTILVIGIINASGCAGDLVLFSLLLRLDNRNLVARHKDRIGFVVV